MKIWVILEAEDTDYSQRFGFSRFVEYKTSESQAIERTQELNDIEGYSWYYFVEVELDLKDFSPTAS